MLLHIEKQGTSNKSVILLHGFGVDSQIWRPVLPLLRNDFTIILVDLPGFGCSDEMSWEVFRETLCEALSAECMAVGWSLGGAYAMRLAIEVPWMITNFMAIAASPKFIATEAWPGMQQAAVDEFAARFQRDPEQTVADFLKLHAPHRTHLTVGRPPSMAGLLAGLDVLNTWDLRDRLQEVSRGSFLFGGKDPIIPVATHAAIASRYTQFECVTIPQAKHAPFLSHPAEFMHYLKKQATSG